MSRMTYAISAFLTISGTGTTITGIVLEEGKPIGIGLVLLLGAAVFARLYIGTRRKSPSSGSSLSEPARIS